jgi:hypothetical protein
VQLTVALALALTGCRLGVTADAEVAADGSGTAIVELRFDEELLDELDAIAVDPTLELEAAAESSDGWTLERRPDGEGLALVLRHEVEDAGGFGDAFRSLSAGLVGEDPGLLIDLEVLIEADGASSVTGTVGLRPPATAGASLDGTPIGPDAARLAELVRDHVDPRLQVTLPGRPVAHDADEVDGRTLVWEVPVDGERAISASASVPTWRERASLGWMAAAALGVGALLAGLLVVGRGRGRAVSREA